MSFTVDANEKAYFHMGGETHKVPMELFSLNRRRLCQRLQNSINIPDNSYIFLEAGEQLNFYNTDTVYAVFQQEPFFFWAFGCTIPGCIGLIDTKTCDSHLFLPRQDRRTWIRMGTPYDRLQLRFVYNLKGVEYLDRMDEFLDKMEGLTLLTLNGVNMDSGLHTAPVRWEHISMYRVMPNVLHNHMVECRALKTVFEIDLMRYVAKITALAHRAVMSHMRPGMMEYHGEAEFRSFIYRMGGCRYYAYIPGCASGMNTAIINYGNEYHPNTGRVGENDLMVCTMGASYCGYCADVCTTFPPCGTFTDDQKVIYNIILRMHEKVFSEIRPGAKWLHISAECNKLLLQELIELGILQGDIQKMLELYIPSYFQPHATCHMVGVCINDVGGLHRDNTADQTVALLQLMRFNRILEKDMVLAIESALMFIPFLMNKLLNDPSTSNFCVFKELNRFWRFGGARIVDTVVVTANGYELLSSGLPRTVTDIETYIKKREILNALQSKSKEI